MSDECEEAYGSFVGRVEVFKSGVTLTEQQEQDLYDTVVFRPISSWQIFQAGWDAASRRTPGPATKKMVEDARHDLPKHESA